MNSFAGKILHVDLGSGKTAILSVPEEVYQAVLSGKGLEAWYLYNHIPAGADPLGPDNILAFACGALCGTGAFLTGRWTVAGKSEVIGLPILQFTTYCLLVTILFSCHKHMVYA